MWAKDLHHLVTVSSSLPPNHSNIALAGIAFLWMQKTKGGTYRFPPLPKKENGKSAGVEGTPGNTLISRPMLPLPRGGTVVERLGLQSGKHLRTMIEGPANQGEAQVATECCEHLRKTLMWKLREAV